MALKTQLCGALLLVCSLTWACRSTSVCSDHGCVMEPPQNAAGAPPQNAAGGAAGEPGVTNEDAAAGAGASMRAAGGEAGAAGAGGEAGAQGPAPLVCDTGWGDCDGSTLNGCESNLHLSVRHCGSCGSACAGLCLTGTCKKGELLFLDGSPRQRVATQGSLFTVMSNWAGDKRTLYMFDLTSGEGKALFELFGYEQKVSLGNDRVYLKDGGDVLAISFDGERVTPVMGPDGPLSAWHFGATSSGLYYVDSNDDATVWTLSYRANDASDWKVIYEGEQLELMSAGPRGVALLRGNWESVSRELMLAINGELRTLGTVPEYWGDISVYEDRVAVIRGIGDLSWYGGGDEQPILQPVPADFYSDETFVPTADGLTLVSSVGHESAVQCYIHPRRNGLDAGGHLAKRNARLRESHAPLVPALPQSDRPATAHARASLRARGPLGSA